MTQPKRRRRLSQAIAKLSGAALSASGIEFEELQNRIGYRFRDRGLLEHALTHRSRAAEDASGGVADNESLEFLRRRRPGPRGGRHALPQVSRIRRGAEVKDQGVGRFPPRRSRGTQNRSSWASTCCWGGGKRRRAAGSSKRCWADAYEALIAALYLDGGLPEAAAFLERELNDAIEAGASQTVVGHDYKSALQERLQALGSPLPEYRVAAEAGPDHRKMFTIEVAVAGEILGGATGKAKKEAEQEAARLALLKLET